MQLLEYDQSERFSAARALKHRCLSGAATAETPVSAVGRSVMSSVDSAVNSVIDTKAFTSMRESLSEAELYSALAEDNSEDDKPPKDMPRTVAWWQSRAVRLCFLFSFFILCWRSALCVFVCFWHVFRQRGVGGSKRVAAVQRSQDLQGGVLGKLLRPGGGKQRGAVGSATQRAFSSVDVDSSVDEHSSARGSGRGRRGSGGKKKGGEEGRVRGKARRGSGKDQDAASAPKPSKAGLFARFGRKES